MKTIKRLSILIIVTIFCIACSTKQAIEIQGEMKKWHRVVLLFDGPETSETEDFNPFLNYRLDVTFTHGEEKFVVPGFYAADGNAAESGADTGNKWMVRFTPNKTGVWNYSVSFKQGENMAVSENMKNAKSASKSDRAKGSFEIGESDKTGRDNRAKGRLQYVGEHFLQFAESGEYFFKQGADAPENFLAYEDFDNTPNYKNYRKTWGPHIGDWKAGDPTWQSGKGKGIIGAINYLASEEMNVFSFLTYNVGGDDRNVFPMISDEKEERTRYDISKLEQWEIVFEHGDNLGMYLHFKLQERENDGGHATKDMDVALDEGNLGIERKLYLRELVARFGHHLALNWNLGEENEQTTEQHIDMAEYLHSIDPYKHPIVIHTTPGLEILRRVYMPLLGNKSAVTGVSIQGGENDYTDIYPKVAEWVAKSAGEGKKWVVANDEQGKGWYGILPDSEAGLSQDTARHRVIWGTIMAGGAGCEYYFGTKYPQNDMTCQDFRSRDRWWDYARYALQFFEKSDAPFWQMSPDNELVLGNENWCLAKAAVHYVVFLPKGGISSLDLSSVSGTFLVKWFNPRQGGDLLEGSVSQIEGGAIGSLGSPPADINKDWVVYITKSNEL